MGLLAVKIFDWPKIHLYAISCPMKNKTCGVPQKQAIYIHGHLPWRTKFLEH